jgi:hypothetical protein
MSRSLIVPIFAAMLLFPAPLPAADIMQETLTAKAEREQRGLFAKDSQTEQDDQVSGGKRQTPQHGSKSFPGPVLQPQAQTGANTGQSGGQTAPQPTAGAGPKSTKAMYGDIVIHK